jgi:hypothetical protein
LPTAIGSPTVGWEKLDAMCLGVNGSEVASKMSASDWKDKWKIGLYYIRVTVSKNNYTAVYRKYDKQGL